MKNRQQRLLFSVIAFLLIWVNSLAQKSIKVELKDKIEKQPLPYATWTVNNASSLLFSGLADSLGSFSVTINQNDSLKIKASFVGFKSQEVWASITKDTLLVVFLEPKDILLKEIEVKGAKKAIERKVDRTVLSINPKIDKGKKVAELMRKLPFVVVTTDNLTIKGKSNYVIYKNGSPSNLTLLDLKALPSEQVQSIEVIYYPSARFEGEVDQVVNVIMKTQENYSSVSAWAGIGSRSHTGVRNKSIGLTLSNWRKASSQKLNFSFSTDALKNQNEGTFDRNNLPTLYQSEDIVTKNQDLSLGYDYEIHLKNNQELGVGISVSQNMSTSLGKYNQKVLINPIFSFENENLKSTKSINANLNYTKSFSKGGKLYFSNLILFNKEHTDLMRKSSVAAAPFFNLNFVQSKSLNSQLVFEKSLKNDLKTEFGVGIINRSNNQESIYNNAPFVDELAYNQFIKSSFFSLSKIAKKYYFRTGLRLERTSNDIDNARLSTITNWLPQLLVVRTFSENYKFTISYNKKIQRPSFGLLTTFIDQQNPLQEISGNPNLVNESYHNLNLENTFTIKSLDASLGIELSKGENLISSFRESKSGVLIVSYFNLSTSSSVGLNYSLSKPSSNGKWYFFSSGSTKKYKIIAPIQKNDGLVYSINGGATFVPSEKLTIDFFASILENNITLQGNYGNTVYMDLILNYAVGKHGNLMFRSQNPIINKIKSQNLISGNRFSYKQANAYFGRTIELSYLYTLGKTKETTSTLRKATTKDLKLSE